MYILDLLRAWHNQYNDTTVFLGHKITHLIVGAAVAAGVVALGFSAATAVLAVLLVGVGKEIVDENNQHSRLDFHVMDVLVTVLGSAVLLLM